MTELINEKCEACRADSPRVTDKEVAELQPVVSEWAIIEENEIPKLQRVFRYPNFVSSLAFTDAVGALAEGAGAPPANRHRVGPGHRHLVDPQDTEPASQRLRNGSQD